MKSLSKVLDILSPLRKAPAPIISRFRLAAAAAFIIDPDKGNASHAVVRGITTEFTLYKGIAWANLSSISVSIFMWGLPPQRCTSYLEQWYAGGL